jgi:hypothetical protein
VGCLQRAAFLKTKQHHQRFAAVSVNMIIACAMTIVLISAASTFQRFRDGHDRQGNAYLSFMRFPFVFCSLAGILTGVFPA